MQARQQAAGSHHAHLIRQLAQETHTSYDEAKAVYEEELARTERQACVKAYVTVIARKRAHDILVRRHHH